MYVKDIKTSVARKLYAYLHSIVTKQCLLENFWFAIVGQGYGFRLLDYELALNSFELIEQNRETYGSYTNKLVAELLSTRLPTEKMLMQVAIDQKATLIGELRRAVYTAEGSIYSTTLYSLYGGGSFVIWPLYIDEFSILALYPVELKEQIELLVKDNLEVLRHVVRNEMMQLMRAYRLFASQSPNSNFSITEISNCIRKILSMLHEVRTTISRDAYINVYELFKDQYEYNELVFNRAMEILKDNRYVTSDISSDTYSITDTGVVCLFQDGQSTSNHSIINICAENVSGNIFGNTSQGIVNYNHGGINLPEFTNIISQIINTAEKQNQFERNLIMSQVEKLRTEVEKKKPRTEVVKDIVDWVEKITAIAGFAITLRNVLSGL